MFFIYFEWKKPREWIFQICCSGSCRCRLLVQASIRPHTIPCKPGSYSAWRFGTLSVASCWCCTAIAMHWTPGNSFCVPPNTYSVSCLPRLLGMYLSSRNSPKPCTYAATYSSELLVYDFCMQLYVQLRDCLPSAFWILLCNQCISSVCFFAHYKYVIWYIKSSTSAICSQWWPPWVEVESSW